MICFFYSSAISETFWRHFDSRLQVMAGKPGRILPVGYCLLDTAEYAMAFKASDWLYFLRHGINNITA